MLTGLTLPEIRALCTKAARGAGYDWGLAEEAGMAVRWLEARGWPGGALLAQLLEAGEAHGAAQRPAPEAEAWAVDAQPLCPLATGSYLSDSAHQAPLTLAAVRSPALLAPFLAGGVPCRLSWDDAEIEVSDAGIRGAGAALLTLQADVVELATPVSGATSLPASAPEAGGHPRATLERFARRTYVPETEESRSRGAGDGG